MGYIISDGIVYSGRSGGGGGSSTFAGLDDVDFNNLQNGQVPMYDSANSEWINGEIKLGTKTAFSVPINLASKTGSGLVQTFFTYTADNDQFLNVVTTGTTDCGSNDAYISLSKNGTEVERYTLITNTATTHNFAQLNLIEGDTITLKFGWVNNHGAKLNGTANFLSIAGNPRLQPVIYSTEEREIGVWTDGKPLYAKTFYSDMVIPYDSASAVTLNDTIPSNIEVVDIQAYFIGKSSSGTQVYQSDGGKWFIYYYQATENKIYAAQIFTSGGVTNCKTYFTFRYTKTTDTAGSGQWTPQGVPAVHYSTDEHIVGTWTDGSMLYEKTYSISSLSSSSVLIDSNITSETAKIRSTSYGSYRLSGAGYDAQYVSHTSYSIFARLVFNPSGLYANIENITSGVTASDFDITIRYTKSST